MDEEIQHSMDSVIEHMKNIVDNVRTSDDKKLKKKCSELFKEYSFVLSSLSSNVLVTLEEKYTNEAKKYLPLGRHGIRNFQCTLYDFNYGDDNMYGKDIVLKTIYKTTNSTVETDGILEKYHNGSYKYGSVKVKVNNDSVYDQDNYVKAYHEKVAKRCEETTKIKDMEKLVDRIIDFQEHIITKYGKN